ncbi:MAG: hypothetical protein U0Q03_02480 [Acidimicrobiales bacterium]
MTDGMQFGPFGIDNGALADPEPPSPTPPGLPMLDPAVALAYLAVHTSTNALATGSRAVFSGRWAAAPGA